MTPKGRKYAISIGGFFVLMMLISSFAPARMEGAENVARYIGVLFWGLAACLFAYSVWEILWGLRGRDD